MAENLGGKFATMSDEERRRFALDQERAAEEPADELEFDDPRGDHARTKADLEERDGQGALVDDRQHQERVQQEARAREKQKRRSDVMGQRGREDVGDL
jgi:hypothetical protein